MNKLRVGVLMGGRSIEREVSFNSGRTICDHLDTNRYMIVPLFQTRNGALYILPAHFIHRGKISDFEQRLEDEATLLSWDALKTNVDFIYIATHGQYAEDGTLQGTLEVLGIPYLGSGILASALGMDKQMQKDILRAGGISVARGICVQPAMIHAYQENKDSILHQLREQSISFPVIVKPIKEGSSLGVSVVFEHEQLHEALIAAMQANESKEQAVLIEEKIVGMEFSCVSLYDHATAQWHALPPTEVVHQPGTHLFDYEQKYMPGKAIEYTPARCSDDQLMHIQNACIRATQLLGFRTLSRIDGFLCADGSVVIVDPNTLSGMAPASFLFREAAHVNMNHPQLINYLIETELEQYGMLDAIKKSEETHTAAKPRLRVAILMGGRSNEKEISLESGRNVTYKLSSAAYQTIPLFVNSALELYRMDQKMLVRSSTVEIEQLISAEQKVAWHSLPEIADFVFIALHGGEGENGAVQGMLEMINMPYNGSGVLASALCMDKYKTNMFLKHKGFHVPAGMLITAAQWRNDQEATLATITDTLALPLIIKPHDDGCSVMVQKITAPEHIPAALATIFASKEVALIEECIIGMELTIGVIGNENPRALTPSQAVAKGGILSLHEKFLPGAGENQTPAPLAPEALIIAQKTIENVYKTVGCRGYARIDCFYQNAQQSATGQARIVILEINSLPALTPATCIFHQAAESGIGPREFIGMIIEYGLQEHARSDAIVHATAQKSSGHLLS